ncbi:MAG: hypothetical protein A2Z24_00790 [Candidatus Woykebacteria bacterium RBG_16_44_10]|uniref:Uncharacterized protein n=1 Tax=Candidatus Woykebacteria bacterium RBG_16_44_10 TaxID=1802597 RepID=A0A1G1WFL3_9BACT|nr:MAG: hypothetical protein A2Z24_00790 [Candidatus Woykebacteria bacterium RBG_16_44_10]
MNFTFPKLSYLAKRYKISDPYGEGYGKLVQKTVEEVKKKHKNFISYLDEYLPDGIKLWPETATQLEALEAKDTKDTVTLDVDLGDKYRGKSPDTVRGTKGTDILLPTVYVLYLLLEHKDNLCLDISGDMVRYGGEFSCCPHVDQGGSKAWLESRWARNADEYCGSFCCAGESLDTRPLNLDAHFESLISGFRVEIGGKKYRLVEEK